MPQPDVSDVHVNSLLTNISIGWSNEEYIADRVFPPVRVSKQSDIITVYDRDMWLRNTAAVRAPGTRARRTGWNVTTTATYFCRNFALGHAVTVEEIENADEIFDLEVDAMEFIVEQIALAKEVEFAAVAFTGGNWTTTATGTTNFTKWSAYASSTPIEDLRTYARTIRQIIGRRPNVICMGDIVWDRLVDHPDLLERVKYGGSNNAPAQVSTRMLAELIGFQDVVVASALQVTSAEGAGSETRADIIDDDLLMIYRPPRPSRKMPAAGYNFNWAPSGGGAQFIRRYEETVERQTVIEGHAYFDYNVTAADAGALLDDVVD